MEVEKCNLLICLTPLHMVIATKIMEKNPGCYDILCISYNKNEKYSYYFEQITKITRNSFFYLIESKSKLERLYDLLKFKFFIKNNLAKNYSTILLASIDNPFFHLLLSTIGKKHIQTFDDGSANINRKSDYYIFQSKNIFQKIILVMLGNNYSTDKVVIESNKHFTIYNGFKNIIKNTEFIELWSGSDQQSPKNRIKIFLGQPFNDMNFKNKNELFKFLLSNNIINYYPHPRENEIYDGFDYIKSELIFEDYIVNLLKNGSAVEVYTLLSTAALNVVDFQNVKVNVIYESSLVEQYSDLYEIFSIVNCEFINI